MQPRQRKCPCHMRGLRWHLERKLHSTTPDPPDLEQSCSRRKNEQGPRTNRQTVALTKEGFPTLFMYFFVRVADCRIHRTQTEERKNPMPFTRDLHIVSAVLLHHIGDHRMPPAQSDAFRCSHCRASPLFTGLNAHSTPPVEQNPLPLVSMASLATSDTCLNPSGILIFMRVP